MGSLVSDRNGAGNNEKQMACPATGEFLLPLSNGNPECLVLVGRVSAYARRIRAW
jgi:hypothetical protein